MNFFFKYYMKRKTQKEVINVRYKANKFLKENGVYNDSLMNNSLIYAVNFMDCGLIEKYDDFLYEQGVFRSNVFKTPKILTLHTLISSSKYREWYFSDIAEYYSNGEYSYKEVGVPEALFTAGLIENHHAVEHFSEGIIGCRECEDVKAMIDCYALYICNKKPTKEAIEQSIERVINSVTMFYRAVNYGYGSPIEDACIDTYVRSIYNEAKNNDKAASIKRFRKLTGYMFLSDEIVEKLSNATILGAEILNEMGFVNKLFLIRYLNEVVHVPKDRRWPIKYIDLRNLWPYVNTKDISEAINHTLGKNIVKRSERHIEYTLIDGVLSLEIF